MSEIDQSTRCGKGQRYEVRSAEDKDRTSWRTIGWNDDPVGAEHVAAAWLFLFKSPCVRVIDRQEPEASIVADSVVYP